MTNLAIVRVTVLEAVSRRLVLWAGILSVAFLALFWLGFTLLFREIQAEGEGEMEALFAATLLSIMGLYVVSFLTCFIAMLLSVGAVSSEADSGSLQAVLARPLRRSSWLLQRWGGLAGLAAVYAALMGSALLLIGRLTGGYTPDSPVRTLALLALQAVAVLTLGLYASTRLSTVPAGVVAFSLFGLAWLAGIIEFIGGAIGNDAMVNAGIGISLLMPSDALWRAASFYAQAEGVLSQLGSDGIPFAAASAPRAALLWWAVGWIAALLVLALRAFKRRDL